MRLNLDMNWANAFTLVVNAECKCVNALEAGQR